jgi:hypothetical protein
MPLGILPELTIRAAVIRGINRKGRFDSMNTYLFHIPTGANMTIARKSDRIES